MNENYWTKIGGRRIQRRRLIRGAAAGSAGAAALALVGCGDDDDGGKTPASGSPAGAASPTTAATGAAKPVRGGTLRVLSNIGSILDPHTTNTPVESLNIWGAVGNTLVRFTTSEPLGLTEGDLAAGLPEAPGDGTLLTFKLRTEAKWQNKAPVNARAVTAEDVKLSIERIKDPAIVSPRAGQFGNVDSVTVIDPQTVQFKLKAPQADLLNILSDQYNFIIPKEIAARGKDAIKGAADVIGSGPYELTSFEAAQKFTMKRRADGQWRANTAWIDTYEFAHQVDNQQLANAMRANQADVVGLPIDIIKTFQNDKNYVITRAGTPTRECLLINHSRDRYKDPKVRLALWRALNRKQVYENVFGGGGDPGGPMTPAAPAWALPDSELAKLPGFGKRDDEIKEAKKLLSAAGLENGFEETVLTVTAFDTEKVHEILVSNLADVGIKVKTENVGTDFAANFLPREVKRDYNLATTLFLSGGYPDAQLLLYHHSDTKNIGTRNYGDYSNTELDKMLQKQSAIYDAKQRQAAVYDIQRFLINNPGPGWIGSRAVFTLWSARVQNPKSFPFAAGFYGPENIWLKS